MAAGRVLPASPWNRRRTHGAACRRHGCTGRERRWFPQPRWIDRRVSATGIDASSATFHPRRPLPIAN